MTAYWPYAAAAVCLLCVVRCAARQHCGLRSLLGGAVCGLGTLALLGLLVWLLVTKRCRFAVERSSLLSLAVAFAVPFVWYFLLRNHSMVHCWMTYRNLSAAVFALSGGLCFGLKGNGFPEN